MWPYALVELVKLGRRDTKGTRIAEEALKVVWSSGCCDNKFCRVGGSGEQVHCDNVFGEVRGRYAKTAGKTAICPDLIRFREFIVVVVQKAVEKANKRSCFGTIIEFILWELKVLVGCL